MNRLRCLIKEVGLIIGEDSALLKEYIKEQIAAWSTTSERLDQAIDCFEDLLQNTIQMDEPTNIKRPGVPNPKKNCEKSLTLNPPFRR